MPPLHCKRSLKTSLFLTKFGDTVCLNFLIISHKTLSAHNCCAPSLLGQPPPPLPFRASLELPHQGSPVQLSQLKSNTVQCMASYYSVEGRYVGGLLLRSQSHQILSLFAPKLGAPTPHPHIQAAVNQTSSHISYSSRLKTFF